MIKKILMAFLFCTYANAQVVLDWYRNTPTVVDPITQLAGLDLYVNKTTLQGGTVENDVLTGWNSVAPGTLNATPRGTPLLGIAPDGDRQYKANNVSAFTLGTPAALDYVPGTDAFYVIFKVGEATLVNGCIFCKSTAATATRQYQIEATVTSTLTIYIGGVNVILGTQTISIDDIFIINVGLTTLNIWRNGIQIVTNAAVTGTATNTVAVDIGSRGTGLFLDSGSLELVASGTGNIVIGEITAISTFWAN